MLNADRHIKTWKQAPFLLDETRDIHICLASRADSNYIRTY